MERQSSKHSPRVDEEMRKEAQSFTQGQPVESRAQESREKEPPDEGSSDVVELRVNVARFIEGRIFPAARDEIISDAEGMGATDEVLTTLKGLPDRRYEGLPEVWEALGIGMK